MTSFFSYLALTFSWLLRIRERIVLKSSCIFGDIGWKIPNSFATCRGSSVSISPAVLRSLLVRLLLDARSKVSFTDIFLKSSSRQHTFHTLNSSKKFCVIHNGAGIRISSVNSQPNTLNYLS